jgi:hypothetical protein
MPMKSPEEGIARIPFRASEPANETASAGFILWRRKDSARYDNLFDHGDRARKTPLQSAM